MDYDGNELVVINGALTTIVDNSYPPILFKSLNPARFHENGLFFQWATTMRTDLMNGLHDAGYNQIAPILNNGDMFVATRTIDHPQE